MHSSTGVCAHQRFEAHAARAPDAVAVAHDGGQVTYGELNARANRLAHHLRAHGVGPEVVVGLCLQRSVDLVVGVLAIHKAGGAYLPLDASYPRERLAYMLDQAGARAVVSQQRLATALPRRDGLVVLVDADAAQIAARDDADPASGVTPHNAAYVIYTSGSTGEPKGVVIPFKGINDHLRSRQRDGGCTSADRVLLSFSITFDPSVWELFAPLVEGGSLVLAPPAGQLDPGQLARLLREHQVTAFQVVPPVLARLLEDHRLGELTSLRHVYCGGETLPPAVRDRFLSDCAATLHNIWGATEATIGSTDWICSQQADRAFVPIGRPNLNAQVHVLDQNLEPAPIGVPGELYIGGSGLARGYLARPGLTAERFIPDPFATAPGGRLYRTGDLGRYVGDGAIEYLGRIDLQVKVRGFRVEPGEVEAALNTHPAVRTAAVLADTEPSGDKRLVAYVASAAPSLSVEDLRGFLRQRLPQFMMPAAYVMLDELPLTANGKVDRTALPRAAARRPELTTTYVPPRGSVEQALARMWCEVLRLDRVGARDNLFELGGHSLTVIQLSSRVQRAFALEVPVPVLFDHPTIQGLAAHITASIVEELDRLTENQARELLDRLS
jgi:amino acid adenylation domain-containing protein